MTKAEETFLMDLHEKFHRFRELELLQEDARNYPISKEDKVTLNKILRVAGMVPV